jgi:DNA-directed RNA polymerase specialized sigma24 family protein
MTNFFEQLEQLAREKFPKFARHASDDARQNAYLYVLSRQDAIEPDRMKQYIMSITKHPRFQDLIPVDEMKTDWAVAKLWVHNQEYQRETRREVIELIACAPKSFRSLLSAVYLEGYTLAECSQRFQLSMSTVDYYVKQGIRFIKEVIHEKEHTL